MLRDIWSICEGMSTALQTFERLAISGVELPIKQPNEVAEHTRVTGVLELVLALIRLRVSTHGLGFTILRHFTP